MEKTLASLKGDLINPIVDTLKSRLTSNFYGTFIIVFVSYNWKGFAIALLSDQPIEFRINYIDCNYTHGWNALFCIVIPLMISFLIILIIPQIELIILKLLRKTFDSREDINAKIEEDNRIRQAGIQLAVNNYLSDNNYQDVLQKSNEKITQLSAELKDREADIDRLNGAIESLTVQLNDRESKVSVNIKQASKAISVITHLLENEQITMFDTTIKSILETALDEIIDEIKVASKTNNYIRLFQIIKRTFDLVSKGIDSSYKDIVIQELEKLDSRYSPF